MYQEKKTLTNNNLKQVKHFSVQFYVLTRKQCQTLSAIETTP